LPNPARDLQQKLIANIMSPRVIDTFEMIDIDEK
jgi:hypothetical protein